ncbi:unnamed protein product [Orchesella dallaii]|uniref:Uncharacterized protein n=1 Tax=Orchesella dallaii TaxID=48710 RepID=A0ABP1RLD9_9HEXA
MEQKQVSQYSFSFCVTALIFQVILQSGHIQAGIITNQDSLSLPAELAVVQSDVAPQTAKNNSASGKVIYTAPYSTVRVASEVPKSLKFLPSATYKKKPTATAVTVANVPVYESTPTTATTTTTTTTLRSTTTLAPQSSASTSPAEINNGVDVVTEPVSEVVTEVGVTEENESQ